MTSDLKKEKLRQILKIKIELKQIKER